MKPGMRLGTSVAAIVVLLPRIADACPACASSQNGGSGEVVLVGVLVALPFVIAGVIGYGIVRIMRRDGGE